MWLHVLHFHPCKRLVWCWRANIYRKKQKSMWETDSPKTKGNTLREMETWESYMNWGGQHVATNEPYGICTLSGLSACVLGSPCLLHRHLNFVCSILFCLMQCFYGPNSLYVLEKVKYGKHDLSIRVYTCIDVSTVDSASHLYALRLSFDEIGYHTNNICVQILVSGKWCLPGVIHVGVKPIIRANVNGTCFI